MFDILKTISSRHHENICEIYFWGVTRESLRPFIGMEEINGSTLFHLTFVSREELSIDWLFFIAAGCFSGLAFLHENEIIHRDIKLSNLMVDTEGKVIFRFSNL